MNSPTPDQRPHAEQPLPEPPRWAERLVALFAPLPDREVVLGDFAEGFADRTLDRGSSAATRWYVGQFISSLPSFLLRGSLTRSIMLGTYVRLALRHIRKRPSYSALNIGGLALAMAVCLLIFQYVAFERSYDRHHPDADQLYRVDAQRTVDGETGQGQHSPFALAVEINETVPEVDVAFRVHPNYGPMTVILTDDNGERRIIREEEPAYYADSAFASHFAMDVLHGDLASFGTPGTLWLSETLAAKYFDQPNPVGEPLEIRSWVRRDFTVGGVYADMPGNTHFQAEMLMPLHDLLQNPQYAESDGWGWTNFMTYASVAPNASAEAAAAKTTDIAMEVYGEDLAENGTEMRYVFLPVADAYLTESNGWFPTGDVGMLRIFGLVALFILVIAWVNYVNLTTARAMERAREVGVRKASGAFRRQLVSQFLVEATLVNGIALVLAMGIAALGLPLLNQLAGTEITFAIWTQPSFWAAALLVLTVGSILASLYPAFVLSSFRPITVLKDGLGTAFSKDRLRRALVVFQFAASLALLIGTYAVYQQVQHLRTIDLGYEADRLLLVSGPSAVETDSVNTRTGMMQALAQRIEQQSAVQGVAMSDNVPGNGYNWGTSILRSGAPATEEVYATGVWINAEFAEVYDLTFVAGRNFGEAFAENDLILNRAAIDELGFESPELAIGQTILMGGAGSDNEATIVGVVENIYWASAHEEIAPFFFFPRHGGAWFTLRVASDDLGGTIASVRASFEEVFPGNPFEYRFVDEQFNQLYEADRRFGTLFGVFASFALVVACLGLVGLAAYTAGQRTKEMGVRKVLGAKPTEIARLLFTDIGKLVGVALVIAVPLMAWGVGQWLQDYAARIDLSVGLFVWPAIVVLLLAMGTVSYHTVRLALIDPARALRRD
ncbi:MAG: ABC transporter permease [Bacteroidota bacterium]